jgi:DNA topoisomerase-6 subunit B
VAVKELVDNALDAAEESGIPPEIAVTPENSGITVSDNGPGIAPGVVARILDYASKTSSKDFLGRSQDNG